MTSRPTRTSSRKRWWKSRDPGKTGEAESARWLHVGQPVPFPLNDELFENRAVHIQSQSGSTACESARPPRAPPAGGVRRVRVGESKGGDPGVPVVGRSEMDVRHPKACDAEFVHESVRRGDEIATPLASGVCSSRPMIIPEYCRRSLSRPASPKSLFVRGTERFFLGHTREVWRDRAIGKARENCIGAAVNSCSVAFSYREMPSDRLRRPVPP